MFGNHFINMVIPYIYVRQRNEFKAAFALKQVDYTRDMIIGARKSRSIKFCDHSAEPGAGLILSTSDFYLLARLLRYVHKKYIKCTYIACKSFIIKKRETISIFTRSYLNVCGNTLSHTNIKNFVVLLV